MSIQKTFIILYMYSKEDLLSKSSTELAEVAQSLGLNAEATKDENELIYAILDKQAEEEGKNNPLVSSKRKRVRIGKSEPDKVYSVNGKSGENFDTRKARLASEQPRLFKDPETMNEMESDNSALDVKTLEDELASLPKHRGPKTKRERELLSLIEKAKLQVQAGGNEVSTPTEDSSEATDETTGSTEMSAIPEETYSNQQGNATTDPASDDKIAQLQAKVLAHNESAENSKQAANADGVWSGDPGDGTDFIPVVDLPIEDQGAVPNYDMFDNPTSTFHRQEEPSAPVRTQQPAAERSDYDFADLITANGVLEIMPDGYGFLRSSDYNYLSSPDDIYVSNAQVKHYGLKTGDAILCHVRPPREGEKYFPLTSIDKINGRDPTEIRDRLPFEHLTPLFPDEKFNLCGDRATTNLSTRIVDLFSPIGKGQRALIVAQPKTGKTILMKNIANAIAANHPEAYLMMLLIDERPEEVTDMSRTVNAEVIASTFDEPAERHIKIAGIVLEKAKRMVECGHDVVIFLDSITRLARAYNTVSPASGKVLTGGVDANALQKPKRFFGAARNIEGGGSLTIIATALIDTGSKMDEVIFEEFKGTGNMELQLDRSLSNKRIFPAVNLVASSTRRDDLLQDEITLQRMRGIRNYIADMNPIEAMRTIHDPLSSAKDNYEFLMSING